MKLSQSDTARRLIVFSSVLQRLWSQFSSEDSVSKRPCPRSNTDYICGKPFSNSFGPKKENHYCASSCFRLFYCFKIRISVTTMCSQFWSRWETTSCECPTEMTAEKCQFMLGHENTFEGPGNNWFLYCSHRRVQIHTR